MEKIIIHKNKGEVFECQFKIDGTSIDGTEVRLCLEFDTNKNMFFYGTLENNGTCSIDIPVLKELSNQNGKLFIEAIADSTYFRLYEADVEIKNSVEMSVLKKPKIKEGKKTIQLEQIAAKKKTKEPIIEEKVEVIESTNPYVVGGKPKIEKPKSGLSRFDDFMKKKR